ncbi:MAG TPA: hypothetical protein VMU17_06495 [Elusimicrobiota bacterium]|nr:hypothetical protein [Elusimicrobiota bacterium]
MARRSRRQHVVLRQKRRDEIQRRARVVFLRGLIGALGVGFALGVVSKGDGLFAKAVRDYTPSVEINAPPILAGVPVEAELPANRFWLWFPGAAVQAERRIRGQFPGVASVDVQRDLAAKRIRIRLQARTPLVRWNESGIDAQGVAFPISADAWPQLPKVQLANAIPLNVLGPWLARLSRETAIWDQTALISTVGSGEILVQTRMGAVVNWGAPDPAAVGPKASALRQVLDDAHQHLGGASTADLRFFEDGRIIMKPKGT